MKIKANQRIEQINIKVANSVAGLLEKQAQFQFSYHSNAQKPVASIMPIDKRHYQSGALFPIFEMNIPEGYVRHRITEQLRKLIKVDAMLFLALQGKSGIGCLSYEAKGFEHENMVLKNYLKY
jgi:serine/threonine-protein kinase HipA